MLGKNISLTLALRYLNPLRSHFSIITFICLLGVALGVMVLVVVLSVMGGLVKDIEERLLAFAPHVQVNYYLDEGIRTSIGDWETLQQKLDQIPEIVTSYGLVEDNALLDAQGVRQPGYFRAIDTTNEQQLNDLKSLIKDGSFELDLGEKAVVSSLLAERLNLRVGSNLGVLTLRNLQDISNAYSQLDKELLITRFPEKIKAIEEFAAKAKTVGENEFWNTGDLNAANETLSELLRDARDSEAQILSDIIIALDNPAGMVSTDNIPFFAKGTKDQLREQLDVLRHLDKKDEDLEALSQIKEFVLPKDLEVIGIYQASQHVMSPDIFIPLGIGQDLVGFEDNSVMSLAVRVKDAHELDAVEAKIMAALPKLDGPSYWKLESWKDKYQDWFTLMQRERSMMNFVLSFISLISAFCIMSVMFTVSIQRKKELAVIKALGATPAQIIRVFMWQGVIIGFIGAILGVGLGVLVLHYRLPIQGFLSSMGADPFPMDFHGVELPAVINPMELLTEGIKAFVMVSVASILPAFFVAYQDPAKALRSL